MTLTEYLTDARGAAEPAQAWLLGLKPYGREVLHRAASVVGCSRWLGEVRAGRLLPGSQAFSLRVFKALDPERAKTATIMKEVRAHLLPWAQGKPDLMQGRSVFWTGSRPYDVRSATLTGQIIDRRRPTRDLVLEVTARERSFRGKWFKPSVVFGLGSTLGLKGWEPDAAKPLTWIDELVSLHVLDHTMTHNGVLRLQRVDEDAFHLRLEALCGLHWTHGWAFRLNVPLFIEAPVRFGAFQVCASSRKRADALLAKHGDGGAWAFERSEGEWHWYRRA